MNYWIYGLKPRFAVIKLKVWLYNLAEIEKYDLISFYKIFKLNFGALLGMQQGIMIYENLTYLYNFNSIS